MHIKSIILDGFKSYGKRTEIKGFDQQFNAITGLNGTGKSNVLDSICFVLGISNLSQVRATSLQDLVYKSGQAGVRQASVTLIFDNLNKAQSPIGFENKDEICITRQVVIGGKNKYLLNGRVVLNNRIQDLFASVKLNINNPNFLIMQGRVTKVLNMKPLEILSMIEEAVGSKMFDQKMLKSMQIFQKKSEKLTEFQSHLDETIKPRLAKLEKDKILFLEFQRISKEIDYLTRIHVSFKYVQLRKFAGQYEKKIEDIQTGIAKHLQGITDAEEKIKAFVEEIAAIEQEISGQTKTELKELEQNLKEVETSEAKIQAEKNILTNGIKAETKNLKAIEKTLTDDKATYEKRVGGMRSEEAVYNEFQGVIEEDTKAFELAQKNFEAVSCGLEVNDEGQASSLLEQLMKAKEVASEENTTLKQCEMQLKNVQKQLQAKRSEKHKKDSTYVKEKENMDRIEKELHHLQQSLSQIHYEEGSLEQLEQRAGVLRNELQRVQYDLDNNNSYRYDFQYKNPEPNFDRRRVFGMVCRLFRVKDPKFYMALETCAGGSLYSVVTDTDVTGKLILERGELQKRTTMIPLNKIKTYTMDQRIVNKAKEVGGRDQVFSALSLIEYEPHLEPVMKFIFGGTFVCTDMNVAKKVTYHREVMHRSVTLEGDVLDPEGSLSGGAAARNASALMQVAEIDKNERMFQQKKGELGQVEGQIR